MTNCQNLSRIFSLALTAIFLWVISFPALAGGWEKYGITHEPTQREMDEDQKYGGYPNNKFFNNDTKCSKVVNLFDTPQMGPSNPKMIAFLSYAKIKLAEIDVVTQTYKKTSSLVDQLGEAWGALPAAYATYCRAHPYDTLDKATMAVYEAAQVSAK